MRDRVLSESPLRRAYLALRREVPPAPRVPLVEPIKALSEAVREAERAEVE